MECHLGRREKSTQFSWYQENQYLEAKNNTKGVRSRHRHIHIPWSDQSGDSLKDVPKALVEVVEPVAVGPPGEPADEELGAACICEG
jgi:hypothetical protein